MRGHGKRILALLVVLAFGVSAVGFAANVGGDVGDWLRVVRTRQIEFHGATFGITRASSDTTDYVADTFAGFGLTGGLGKLPIVQVMDGVAALSADGVHAAITIPTGATLYTDTTDSITSPVHYRALTITGSAAAALSNVIITGTNWAGQTITETITGTGGATVQGLYPFKTVTNIRVYGVTTPAGATYTIGWGEKLGLYRPIAATGDVTQIATKATADTAWTVTAAGVLPTGATVSATYGTVDPETTITAVDGYMITYNASTW